MAAELFSILCTTCQARLKVCRVEAIGKILSCPRCHSMVEVVPPDTWRRPDAPVAVEESASISSIEATPAAANHAIADAPHSGPDSPTGSSDQSISNAVKSKQKPAIATAVGGLAIGSLALLALYASGSMGPAGAPVAETSAELLPPGSPDSDAPSSAPRTSAETASEASAKPGRPSGSGEPVSSTISADPPTRPATDREPENNVAPGEKNSRQRESPDPVRAVPATSGNLPADRTTRQSRQSTSFRPPTNNRSEAASPASEETPVGSGIPATTANPSGGATTGQEPGSADQPTDVSDNEARRAAESKPHATLQPTTEPVDVQARLNDSLVQIDFQDVPLLAMTRFLIELTRIPITLDLDSLAAVGITPTSPVSVHQQETTVHNVLRHIAEDRNLSYRRVDDQIVIGGAPRDTVRVVYDVGDLLGRDAADDARGQLTELMAFIERLVEPATWQINGGVGSITAVPPGPPRTAGDPANGNTRRGKAIPAPAARHGFEVAQTPVVQQKVARFLSRLRLARGLPIELPASAGPRVTLETRRTQAGDKLEQRLTFTFAQPTRLLDIAEALGRLSQLTLVINWHSLARLGITPTSSITCSAVDQSVGEALAEQLAHYDLAWRAVDRSTLEIVSRADAARMLEIEFHQLPATIHTEADQARLLQDLQETVAPRTWLGAGGQGVALFDAPSNYLIVRQTQAFQHEVRRYLDARRSTQH